MAGAVEGSPMDVGAADGVLPAAAPAGPAESPPASPADTPPDTLPDPDLLPPPAAAPDSVADIPSDAVPELPPEVPAGDAGPLPTAPAGPVPPAGPSVQEVAAEYGLEIPESVDEAFGPLGEESEVPSAAADVAAASAAAIADVSSAAAAAVVPLPAPGSGDAADAAAAAAVADVAPAVSVDPDRQRVAAVDPLAQAAPGGLAVLQGLARRARPIVERGSAVRGAQRELEFVPVSDQQLAYLSTSSRERVLTAPGFSYDFGGPHFGLEPEAADRARLVAAYTDNGVLLVDPDAPDPDGYAAMLQAVLIRTDAHVKYRCHIKQVDLRALYKRQADHVRLYGQISGPSEFDDGVAQANLRRMLRDAAAAHSSDIHLRRDPSGHYCAFRIDGALRRQDQFDSYLRHAPKFDQLLRAAFYAADEVAGAVLAEGSSQFGRISRLKYHMDSAIESVRLQFMPIHGRGFLLVMRLLYVEEDVAKPADVQVLGYADRQVRLIRQMRQQPNGMFLVSGITGSGKSTTLQRCLQRLMVERNYEIHAIAIEDPPELTIRGVSQVPVSAEHDDRAKAFQEALKAAMRADPDVIMLGEIRDGVTASTAVEATLTGHQLWGTVHATSAILSLQRLIEQGVSESDLLDPAVVRGLIGQRLVRRVCPVCSMNWSTAQAWGLFAEIASLAFTIEEFLDQAPGWLGRVRCANAHGLPPAMPATVWQAQMDAGAVVELGGRAPDDANLTRCTNQSCRGGYLGRTVISEVVVPDQEFMTIYRSDGAFGAREHWAQSDDGFSMAEHGLVKMVRGWVDPRDLGSTVGWLDLGAVPLPRLDERGFSEYPDSWPSLDQAGREPRPRLHGEAAPGDAGDDLGSVTRLVVAEAGRALDPPA